MNHEFLIVAEQLAENRGLPFKADPSLWGTLDVMNIIPDNIILESKQHKVTFQKGTYTLEWAARSLMLKQWERIFNALRDIPSVVLKGPGSSLQLYGNPLVREYTDIDILVDQEITHILTPLGWTCITDTAYGKIVQQPKHLVYTHKDCPFRIEVHQEIYHDGEFSTRELLERRVLMAWEGTIIPVLSLKDLGVYIIEHGTKHAWCLLHWLLDLGKFLLIDDEYLHRETAELLVRLNKPQQFKISLQLLTSLFPVAIPGAYLSCIPADLDVSKQVLFCRDALEHGGRKMTSFRSIIRFNYTYKLAMTRRMKEKFKVIIHPWKVPPRDLKALPLPKLLQPLHLILRPFFVISRRIGARRIK